MAYSGRLAIIAGGLGKHLYRTLFLAATHRTMSAELS